MALMMIMASPLYTSFTTTIRLVDSSFIANHCLECSVSGVHMNGDNEFADEISHTIHKRINICFHFMVKQI